MTDEKYTLKSALVEFKKKKLTIVKGKVNPFFKSNYADLTIILETIEEDLAQLGLIIYSDSKQRGDSWSLDTHIIHKDDGEGIVSSFPLFGNKPQEFGSSITYARRYNIQSLLNLCAEDDDDGNKANNAKPIKKEPKMLTGQEYLDLQKKIRLSVGGLEFENLKAEARDKWEMLLPAQQVGITNAVEIKEQDLDSAPKA